MHQHLSLTDLGSTKYPKIKERSEKTQDANQSCLVFLGSLFLCKNVDKSKDLTYFQILLHDLFPQPLDGLQQQGMASCVALTMLAPPVRHSISDKTAHEVKVFAELCAIFLSDQIDFVFE
jgi:hypothetical protein